MSGEALIGNVASKYIQNGEHLVPSRVYAPFALASASRLLTVSMGLR